LPESQQGGFLPEGLEQLKSAAEGTAAVLVGPGMVDADMTCAFVQGVLALFKKSTVVLDAHGMECVRAAKRFTQPVILTPHAGEMAHLIGDDKEDVQSDPVDVAARHAAGWNAVLALKGATTCIATADGRSWRHEARTPGLATSGSGDVLAGLIAGLAARGAAPEQAAVWGVALHARAGAQLAQRFGTVGYLARELAAEVPALMESLTP